MKNEITNVAWQDLTSHEDVHNNLELLQAKQKKERSAKMNLKQRKYDL